jgi:hypothetical protein
MGFVSGASLIFVAALHDSMNGENFEHWMDVNATPAKFRRTLNYCDGQIVSITVSSSRNLHPTQSWRKDKIIAWLQEKGIYLCRGIIQS